MDLKSTFPSVGLILKATSILKARNPNYLICEVDGMLGIINNTELNNPELLDPYLKKLGEVDDKVSNLEKNNSEKSIWDKTTEDFLKKELLKAFFTSEDTTYVSDSTLKDNQDYKIETSQTSQTNQESSINLLNKERMMSLRLECLSMAETIKESEAMVQYVITGKV